MKRVYTDERFPGFEVVNYGSGTFEVYENGKKFDDFESWENPDGTVSEGSAAQRAQDYFDRWEKTDLSGEYEARMRAVSPEEADAADHTDIVNAPAKPVTGQIDDLMAQERLAQDPKQKELLRDQIMRLMQKESVAEMVVSYLLFES